MSAPRSRLPVLDVLDPALLADPYPAYRALRAGGAVCRVPPASLGVTRHAAVSALLRDARLANVYPSDNPAFALADGAADDAFRRIIPTRDSEDHALLHRLVTAALGGRAARRYTERLREVVAARLDAALAAGSLDVVADLAFPVAATTVSELIGLPPGAPEALRPRAEALSEAFTPFLPTSMRAEADAALGWLREYIGAQVRRARTGGPGDDLVSVLAADDRLTDSEVVDNLAFLCFTGFETTMSMITTGCLALAGHPEQWDLLRADPAGRVAGAVEEFVRIDPPLQYTARTTREAVDVDGHRIRAGRSVLLLLGSANHDEDVFADPAQLDVTRSPNPHVGFGGGVRGCLGSSLARIEGREVFALLAERVRALSPLAEPTRHPSVLFRHHVSAPVAVTAA